MKIKAKTLDFSTIEKAEAYFQQMGEKTFVGSFITDGEATFVETSPGFDSLLGYNTKDLVGKGFSAVMNEAENVQSLVTDLGVKILSRAAKQPYRCALGACSHTG